MARTFDRIDVMMLALVLMWGTAFAGLKVLLQTLGPYQLTWFRYLPFVILYGVWLVLRRRDRFAGITGPDWLRFVAAGILGVAGYHFPLNWAFDVNSAGPGITAATGSILVATTPLFTLLYALLLRQEQLDGAKMAASAVALAGVAVVVLWGRGDAQGLTWDIKALVALIAPAAWGGYSFVAKPLIARHGGLFTTGLTFSLGTLLLIAIGIDAGLGPVRALSATGIGWLLFVSLGATVLGYTMWNTALKHRSPTQVTVYIYLIPVVATTGGYLILGEAITAWFVAGAALVLVGVVWLNRLRAAPKALPADP